MPLLPGTIINMQLPVNHRMPHNPFHKDASTTLCKWVMSKVHDLFKGHPMIFIHLDASET